MVKDYKLDIKLKNNKLFAVMVESGYESVAELSRAMRYSEASIGACLNLKISLKNARGDVRPVWLRLSEFFRRLPEDLLPKANHDSPLLKNTGSTTADYSEVQGMIEKNKSPENKLLEKETNKILENKLDEYLTDREKRILKERAGFNGEPKTYHEIGELEGGISNSRVMQIEAKALRKLRKPSRTNDLKKIYKSGEISDG